MNRRQFEFSFAMTTELQKKNSFYIKFNDLSWTAIVHNVILGNEVNNQVIEMTEKKIKNKERKKRHATVKSRTIQAD